MHTEAAIKIPHVKSNLVFTLSWSSCMYYIFNTFTGLNEMQAYRGTDFLHTWDQITPAFAPPFYI